MKNAYVKIIQITPSPKIQLGGSLKVTKHRGLLKLDNKNYNCSLGKAGLTTLKKEGDGATPIGYFNILYGYYRNDRIKLPATGLTMIPISKNIGWCDAPQCANYNQSVTIPHQHSHEKLMRDDRLYDICLILNYNIPKSKSYVGRNKGSAIFFHITKEKTTPTQGCIAIEPELMMHILARVNSSTIVDISL